MRRLFCLDDIQMAYSEFTLSRVREAFGLIVEELKSLFLEILPTQNLKT
jgi:hypothetical protein